MKELIDKDLLKEELNTRIEVLSIPGFSDNPLMVGEKSAYLSMLSFLDTLELKEVDLEKEFDKYCENLYVIDIQEAPFTEMYDCAKYFFELGLKQKENKL